MHRLAFCFAAFAAAQDLSTIEHGGLKRTYRLYRPENAPRPAPLVIVLHGAGGESARMPRVTGFNELARREGFLVAYADGFERHWNDLRGIPEWSAHRNNVDDVGFFSALIDRLVASEGVDPRRVYVTGISNGGLMSHRLGCELAGKVAAIAPVVRTLTVKLAAQCRPARPIPVLMFFGTADKLVPFEGGIQKMGSAETPVLSARQTVRRWAELDGCGRPEVSRPESTVEFIHYSGCRQGARIDAYIREGAGHSWPPGATEAIWSFFRAARIQ
ncbi:MAG: PHB depolymerase family esterase [Bryobacteraceae bacterium]